jgi:hypothetical protein
MERVPCLLLTCSATQEQGGTKLQLKFKLFARVVKLFTQPQ